MKPQSEPRPGYPLGPERMPATEAANAPLRSRLCLAVRCTPGFLRLAGIWVNHVTSVSHALYGAAAAEEPDEPDNQEYEEQHLGDSDGSARQPSETQHGGDQGQDQKHQRPMQHLQPPGAPWAPLSYRARRPPLCEYSPARLTVQPTEQPGHGTRILSRRT